MHRCFEGFGTPWNGLGNISCDYSKAMDPFRPMPLRSARRLHAVWQAFNDAKIPQNFLGRFLDNADFQRICSIDPSLTVLRSAPEAHASASSVIVTVSVCSLWPPGYLSCWLKGVCADVQLFEVFKTSVL